MKGKVLLWLVGMAASIGTVVWCEIDDNKRRKKDEEYWKKQSEELAKMEEMVKADLEYFKQLNAELQEGTKELCAAEVICPEVVAKLKAEGKWLETEEDGYRYFTE